MALAEIPRHRFSVEEYHRMGDVGLLDPAARVELIEGELIDMSPTGRLHKSTVNRMALVLQEALSRRVLVQVQASVRLSATSEPEPDLALLTWRDDFYASRHPGPADIEVLVEVGLSSARYDRLVKLPLYARSAVAEVWLVDLETWTIQVMTHPGPHGYGMTRAADASATVSVLDVEIPVSDLLGPERPQGGGEG
jgi:Uma2 family endonuclease